MDEEEQEQAGGSPVHIPTVGGAVVLAYNVPDLGQDAELKLTGPVIADIFLGNVTTWDDPAIADLNPDIQLPSSDLTVVHRSDGSGTTEIFTTYLAGISQDWANGRAPATRSTGRPASVARATTALPPRSPTPKTPSATSASNTLRARARVCPTPASPTPLTRNSLSRARIRRATP